MSTMRIIYDDGNISIHWNMQERKYHELVLHMFV